MARTGLRMMPTSPSPPLKFRTLSFPQYGFKASLSDRACRRGTSVKPVPAYPPPPPRLLLSFAGVSHHDPIWHCVQIRWRVRRPLCEKATLSTPGVLGSGPRFALSGPHRLLRPHPSVSQARGDFTACRLYAAPSLCGHAEATPETFPTFTAVLSARATDPTPTGPRRRPVSIGAAVPGFLELEASRHPQCPSLPAILDGIVISALHRSLYAAARAFAKPS